MELANTYFMKKSECYLKCTQLESEFKDENGNFKILTNKEAKFKIQILKILPIKNDKIKNDYLVGFKTKHLTTLEEKDIDFDVLNMFYY